MPAADLALLEAAARAAGEIALRHFGGDRAARDKPGGHGPVTEADLEVDRMLRARLTAARPGYGWLSEESDDDPARLAAERVFIVDPIDGTRAFVAGGDAWGPSLAVGERGRITAGVVHLPRLGRTYAAAAGRGATRDGAPIAAADRAGLDGAEVLLARSQLAPVHWPGGVPQLSVQFRPPLAYRLCLAAEGRADAALTFHPVWEWDVAAGALIAAEAGATVTDRAGAALVFNNPEPRLPGVVVAGAVLHDEILRRHRGAANPQPAGPGREGAAGR